jgi:hypothetical protein
MEKIQIGGAGSAPSNVIFESPKDFGRSGYLIEETL